MKVLFLVQKDQRAILDRLYEGVAAHCECDLRWLSGDEQRNLRRYFRREVDVSRYDRIVFSCASSRRSVRSDLFAPSPIW